MDEAIDAGISRAARAKPKPPEPGFWKQVDWIKAAKELGFPVVVAGFVIWKGSVFVDSAMRASDRTAESVQKLNERHIEISTQLSRQTDVLERIDRGQDRLIDKVSSKVEAANRDPQ